VACSKGTDQVQAGLLDEAAKTFTGLVGGPDGSGCGTAGLRVTAQAYLDRAKVAAAAGRTKSAQGDLDKALQLQPDLPVPAELQELGPAPEPAALHDLRYRAAPALAWGQVVIKVLLVLLAIVLALVLYGAKLRRRVKVGPFTGDDGGPFGALLGVALQRATSSVGPSTRRSDSITYVSAFNENVSLPTELTETVPQAGLVGALLAAVQKLPPNRNRTVTGQLLAGREADTLMGLALSVERSTGEVLAQEVLLAGQDVVVPAPPGRPRYAGLVLPAAYWALWHVDPDGAALLGTTSWESYVNFAVAADLELTSETV
jgi:hypothetical protein